jgi:hypothetical protein
MFDLTLGLTGCVTRRYNSDVDGQAAASLHLEHRSDSLDGLSSWVFISVGKRNVVIDSPSTKECVVKSVGTTNTYHIGLLTTPMLQGSDALSKDSIAQMQPSCASDLQVIIPFEKEKCCISEGEKQSQLNIICILWNIIRLLIMCDTDFFKRSIKRTSAERWVTCRGWGSGRRTSAALDTGDLSTTGDDPWMQPPWS